MFPFFKKLIFIFFIESISLNCEADIIKVNILVFADNDSPPSPHDIAQNESDKDIVLYLLELFQLFFRKFFISRQNFSVNWIGFSLSLDITLYESVQFWLPSLGKFIESEKRLLFHCVIDTRLLQIIGNIIEIVIEARILIIDEDYFVVFGTEEDVACE